MQIIGLRNWQMTWNWNGYWTSRDASPFRGHMPGAFTDLWWFGPVELWRQK